MADTEVKTPEWKSPCIQRFENSCSTDNYDNIEDFYTDLSISLGEFDQNLGEYQHSDPEFVQWYAELAELAHNVDVAMEAFARAASRYNPNSKLPR